MAESVKKSNEGGSAKSVPEVKGLAELLREIDLAENPWKDPEWDLERDLFPQTHPLTWSLTGMSMCVMSPCAMRPVFSGMLARGSADRLTPSTLGG